MTAAKNWRDWKPGDPVEYLKEEAPDFGLPEIAGEHYDILVPDTLDLSQRALFGLNALTETLDPSTDYDQFFWVYFDANPPVMKRDMSSICDTKFLESLPLMRIVTGSKSNEHAEKSRLEARLKMVGDDGFLWEVLTGRPWMEPYGCYLTSVSEETSDEMDERKVQLDLIDRYVMTHTAGRWLGVVVLQYELTGNDLWRGIGERLVDAFDGLIVKRGDYAFTPVWVRFPDQHIDPNMEMPRGVDSMKESWIIQGLTQFYGATGSEKAKELAGRLVKYLRHHGEYYGPNGEFISDHRHHHCHDLGLQAMAEYAAAVGDKELLEFVGKGYEHGRSIGNARIGYFPELFPGTPWTSEACSTADMIALALVLTKAGVGDYWDDVDRFLRNHFVEMQLTDPQWVYESMERYEPRADLDPKFWSDDRVIQRNVGSFAGWASANEWYANGRDLAISHCCTGNCTRAIYYAWKSILDHTEDGTLRVNLLLNRASQWADVLSYIPYEGRVEIRVKKPLRGLEIRVPEWVKPEEVGLTVQEETRSLRFDGRYTLVGEVKPNEVVTISFPIMEDSTEIEVEQSKYKVVFKGSTLVDIDPSGDPKKGALYQRSHYRASKAQWKSARWFAPSRELEW